MITAPYNFVPLNKEVFYPEWSEQVSHDTPFEDGESGMLEIEIEAVSPIFIKDSKNKEEFCNHEGAYYIPGSSVKGVIRNVLEIMSFSKMNPSLVDDKTYAVRDLRNQKLYMNKMRPQNLFCGWLKKSRDGYIIEDCGVPGRISQDEISKEFASKFKHQNFKNKPEFKTAKYKYSLLEMVKLTQKFDFQREDKGRRVYIKGAKDEGTIVLTGQASGRKDNGRIGDAKIYEFIFFKSKSEIHVEKEVVDNFKFAYFDERKTEPKESPDWAYWKNKLKKGEKIPVFFQKENNRIKHFGLSYLYKLPYSGSVYDGIYDIHFDDRLDLAQTVFGHTEKESALKGRVQFSHFKALKGTTPLPPRTETLGTPRASYYPFYVLQEDGNTYSTFMDEDFVLAGRKRYPIHKNMPNETKITYNPQSSTGTSFRPLKQGAIFKGKIIYHNLKKAELGALISAFTFHNTPNSFHNIGIAKSLGYGKCKIKIISNVQTKEYMCVFEKAMRTQCSDWLQSPQITELLTMSSEQNNRGSSELKYMELPDFANAKRETEYLKQYSKLDGINKIIAKSIVSSERTTDSDSRAETKSAAAQVGNKPNTQHQKPKPTNETWQDRMIRMAKTNAANPIAGILADLQNGPPAYKGHEKDVANKLKEQMKKTGKWQEEPPKEGKHDNYKLTQKVMKYL